MLFIPTCNLGIFECALSDIQFRNLSQHAIKPVLKIGMSHSVWLKGCWHNGKTIKWVCTENHHYWRKVFCFFVLKKENSLNFYFYRPKQI